MVPEFSGGFGEQMLCCARCGEAMLHQERVEVFIPQQEDDERGLRLSVNIEKVSFETDSHAGRGNPSSRRDGVAITFWCEICHGKSRLTIAQHKGAEYLEIEDIGDKTFPRG